MGRSALELADIFRLHGPAYREAYRGMIHSMQRRVMRAIETCRTAVLGGHVEKCDRCGQRRIHYNSCGNRHCNKCQSLARARWLEKHRALLLPVPYFQWIRGIDCLFLRFPLALPPFGHASPLLIRRDM